LFPDRFTPMFTPPPLAGALPDAVTPVAARVIA